MAPKSGNGAKAPISPREERPRGAAPAIHSPHQNHLLDALPAVDYDRIASHLELITMKLGDVLYESGAKLRYVYFPTTCIVSLLYVMEDGASAEIAIVGNEGILGISLFMGGDTTPSRALVQSAGHAFRLKAELLKDEFGRFGPTMHLLLRYTQALITQMAQTAVCNRHHSVDQQLCRWLLLSLDRLRSNKLSMTQELIANMLGVRREGVTEAAGKLQDAGLISYRRGHDHRCRSPGPGGQGLRVLPGGQDGVRPAPALRRQVTPRSPARCPGVRAARRLCAVTRRRHEAVPLSSKNPGRSCRDFVLVHRGRAPASTSLDQRPISGLARLRRRVQVSSPQRTPVVNHLLESLPPGERRTMLAGCEMVELAFADVLCSPGETFKSVHFPIGGFISLIMPIDDSAALEVGLVGNEGMLGIPLVLGVEVSPVRAVVQGAGPALRIDAATFRRELGRNPVLRSKLDQYVFVQLSQLAQTAACTRFHVVEARLARWLLMTQDRARATTFHITQEFLAYMLGVRRVGITKAASSLQSRRLIHYSRGNITVLDRRGLKAAACGCYKADLDSYERMLG